MRRTTASIRICVLGLCMAMSACERPTAVVLTVDADRPIAPGCIAGLEQAIGPVDAFRTLARSEGSTAQEASIERGSAVVHVHRESDSAQHMQIRFGWLGPAGEQEQRESAALLVDVRDAVLRTCGMDTGSVRVNATCGGPVCELPEIAAMTK